MCGKPKKIINIERIIFNESKLIDPRIISEKIKTKIKKKEENYEVSSKRILKKIIELKSFDYVKLILIKNTLFIYTIEKPRIKLITIYNEKKNSVILKLLRKNKIKSGKLYDFSRLSVFKSRLEHHYSSKGFYNSKVNIKTKLNKDLNFINIEINIEKSEPTRIKGVSVTGNKVFSKFELLYKIRFPGVTWTSWFSKSNVFIKSRLRNDLRKIKLLYLNRGYTDFQINHTKLYLDKKGKIFIDINLFEGEIKPFGRIILEGGYYTRRLKIELREMLEKTIVSGKKFSMDVVGKTKNKLTNFFSDRGYINTKINHTITQNGRFIDVIFNCEISKKIKLRKFNFKGNHFTLESILRRFFPLTEGGILNTKKIGMGRQEILKREVVTRADISYVDCKRKGELDLILKLKEKRSGKFTAGLTYLRNDKFMLNLTSEMSNFLGIGDDFTIVLNKSRITTELNATYVRSKPLGIDFDANFNAHIKIDKFNKKAVYFDYASSVIGFYADCQINLSLNSQINITFGADFIKLKMAEEKAPLEAKQFLTRSGLAYNDPFLTLGYARNTLDRPIYPNKGHIKHINFKIALPHSDLRYFQFNYDVSHYTVVKNHLLQIYANVCYGNTLTNMPYPFFKFFYLKGQNVIRGFKERTLGPKDSNNDFIGGNLMVCAKIFLYFKTPILVNYDSVRTFFFIDSGELFNTTKFTNKYTTKKKRSIYNSFIKITAGVGLTWHSPFGIPLECSFAYPLNPQRADRIKMFALTIGI